MCRSGNTVKEYDSTLGTTWKWRNKAAARIWWKRSSLVD